MLLLEEKKIKEKLMNKAPHHFSWNPPHSLIQSSILWRAASSKVMLFSTTKVSIELMIGLNNQILSVGLTNIIISHNYSSIFLDFTIDIEPSSITYTSQMDIISLTNVVIDNKEFAIFATIRLDSIDEVNG